MRKMTKAYQLRPVMEVVKAFQFKGRWYPITEHSLEDKKVFIFGKGWQKITDSMYNSLTDVESLSQDWTAMDIQRRVKEFSLDVAMGLLQGGGCFSLFNDQSIDLNCAKHELANMAYFGKAYDDFTDKVHELGQRFIKCLICEKGYYFEGCWILYQNEIIGMTGLYENIQLHPLQHIDHVIKGILHVRSMFNSISFEKMLLSLITVHKDYDSILKKYVSVKDRIKFLSTQKIADDFEKIFKWQEVLIRN